MFGNIIYISDTMAHVKLLPNSKIAANLMNVHVVFEDGNSRILGEISDIDGEKIKVNFLGEFDGNKFNNNVENLKHLLFTMIEKLPDERENCDCKNTKEKSRV